MSVQTIHITSIIQFSLIADNDKTAPLRRGHHRSDTDFLLLESGKCCISISPLLEVDWPLLSLIVVCHSTALTYYRAYPAQLRVCHMEMLFLGAVSTAIQCERSFSPRTRPPRAIRPRHGSFPVTARTDMTCVQA